MSLQHDSQSAHELRVNLLLRSAGETLRIAGLTASNAATLENVDTGQQRELSIDALESAIHEGIVCPIHRDELSTLPSMPVYLRSNDEILIEKLPTYILREKTRQQLLSLLHWIRSLERHGVRQFWPLDFLKQSIAEVEKKAQQKCPWTAWTIYKKHLTLVANNNDPRCLAPEFHRRGGPGKGRLPQPIEKAINEVLDLAANPGFGQLEFARIHSLIIGRTKIENKARTDPLPLISVPTVTRRVKERFGAYEICVRRYGKRRADELFRGASVRIRPLYPLDSTQYDDLNTGNFLVDARSSLPFGRAWATLGVDECTRVPLAGC